VQLVLVKTLDTGLADMVGAAVLHRVELLELAFIDAPHIADRMGEVLALRVVAHQLGNHLDAGQTELVHCQPGDLLLAELEQHRHRFERPPPLFNAAFEQLAVLGGEFQHLDDHVQYLPPVAGPFAGQGQAEAGPVVGDDHPVAVVDQPAVGRNRLHVDAVVFRQGGVVVVLDHLQVVHAGDQYQGQHQEYRATDQRTLANQARVLLVIF